MTLSGMRDSLKDDSTKNVVVRNNFHKNDSCKIEKKFMLYEKLENVKRKCSK